MYRILNVLTTRYLIQVESSTTRRSSCRTETSSPFDSLTSSSTAEVSVQALRLRSGVGPLGGRTASSIWSYLPISGCFHAKRRTLSTEDNEMWEGMDWERFRCCNSTIQLLTVLTISDVLRSADFLASEVFDSFDSCLCFPSSLRFRIFIDAFIFRLPFTISVVVLSGRK